jgi:7-carboxy-7-deazaguanine synthase
MTKYPLAPNPVFWTINGEAHLRGFQMVFIRLAGCSVGCPNCDTDYSFKEHATAPEITDSACAVVPLGTTERWVWITGGEPADYDLRELLGCLRYARFSTCVATAGHKRIIPPVDWLSVSPHDPSQWIQTYGNEVKIVPGLNGFGVSDFLAAVPKPRFMYQYVQPLWDTVNNCEDRASVRECVQWLKHNPDWSLSRQDHKWWEVA